MESNYSSYMDDILKSQRDFFYAGKTKSYDFRISSLNKLEKVIKENEENILEALKLDLEKNDFESYMTEIGGVFEEIKFHKKNLKKWMKKKRVSSPMSQFPSKSYIVSEPLGNTLIISPWNYPFQLSILPLIGSISAGNTAIIKPSEFTENTSNLLKNIINEAFDSSYIDVVLGGKEESEKLLDLKFDLIFFTGSTSIGKIVMKKASENLTPVILELGGKSPVIIDKNIDIKTTVKRVAFGKILNSGQTCVAGDYAFIHEDIIEEFKVEYMNYIKEIFPNDDFSNMPKIVNEKNLQRLIGHINGEKTIGCNIDMENNRITPGLVYDIDLESSIMKEELFGAYLPIIPYKDIDQCIEYINKNEKPLALYIFSKDKSFQDKIIENCSFGGGCINDTIIHLANNKLPFGGVGHSGIGNYHGKYSFDCFSHRKSILSKSMLIDIPLRYHPYTDKKLKLIKKILK